MSSPSYYAKLILITLFVLTYIFAAPQHSFANAPKNVTLEYDAASQTLSVTITHPSSFPSFHYIKTVVIKKNGNEVSNKKYENQPDMATYTYKYNIAAAAGETLEVTATCSIAGSKTATLIIGGTPK
jgi:hypothetical protein